MSVSLMLYRFRFSSVFVTLWCLSLPALAVQQTESDPASVSCSAFSHLKCNFDPLAGSRVLCCLENTPLNFVHQVTAKCHQQGAWVCYLLTALPSLHCLAPFLFCLDHSYLRHENIIRPLCKKIMCEPCCIISPAIKQQVNPCSFELHEVALRS